MAWTIKSRALIIFISVKSGNDRIELAFERTWKPRQMQRVEDFDVKRKITWNLTKNRQSHLWRWSFRKRVNFNIFKNKHISTIPLLLKNESLELDGGKKKSLWLMVWTGLFNINQFNCQIIPAEREFRLFLKEICGFWWRFVLADFNIDSWSLNEVRWHVFVRT